MEVKRNRYLQRLIERKGNGLIKTVTGIRRCGKSYLLLKLFHRHLLESGVDEATMTPRDPNDKLLLLEERREF